MRQHAWTKTDRDMEFERTKTTTRTTQRTGAHYQTRTRKRHEKNNFRDEDFKIGKNHDLTRNWERTRAERQRMDSERDAGHCRYSYKNKKKGQGKGEGTNDRDKGKNKTRKRKRTIKKERDTDKEYDK